MVGVTETGSIVRQISILDPLSHSLEGCPAPSFDNLLDPGVVPGGFGMGSSGPGNHPVRLSPNVKPLQHEVGQNPVNALFNPSQPLSLQ